MSAASRGERKEWDKCSGSDQSGDKVRSVLT